MAGTKEGGQKTAQTNKDRYGEDFYKRIGERGGQNHSGKKMAKTITKKYGEDYFSIIGKRGGRAESKRTGQRLKLSEKNETHNS